MAHSIESEFTGKEAEKFYNALKQINAIVESDIPTRKFILALLEIKRIVKRTGYFNEPS